ncbi:MAG TPA: hypothetical protein VIV12_06305 [Streptosporangiaceae bacterium]
MRFAYADPPYLGCGRLYPEHPEALTWDDPETHRSLIVRLVDEFPNGWALSLSSPSLHTLLPMCPADVRVAAWVKPFAAFKRNVRNAYTWEPVLLRGGRTSSRDGAPVTRDHLAEPITLQRGLTGAKPERFCRWILDMLGYIEGDEVIDLFPGTGVMGRVLHDEGRTTVKHSDTGTIPMFPEPEPMKIRKPRTPNANGGPRWSKYQVKNTVKCDRCMLVLAEAKGNAPVSLPARWRRKTSISDELLCYPHAQQQREEDGMMPLKAPDG